MAKYWMRATVKASLYNVPSSQEMTAIVPILFVSEKHTKGYLNLKRDRSGFHMRTMYHLISTLMNASHELPHADSAKIKCTILYHHLHLNVIHWNGRLQCFFFFLNATVSLFFWAFWTLYVKGQRTVWGKGNKFQGHDSNSQQSCLNWWWREVLLGIKLGI